MRTRNWRDVVFEHLHRPYPFLRLIITDDTRADWTSFFDFYNKRVLEIGPGHGTLTERLLSFGCAVDCIEPTIERLQFIAGRLEQAGFKNAYGLHCANALELPFADAQFDCATMIGVLEWVPESVDNGDPRELQLQALREVHRALSSNGTLYLAIENKDSHRYYNGYPDDHTGISHISYLDRKEANLLSQRIRGKDYRTFTYNREEYIELLLSAGFKTVKFYYQYPDYKSYTYMCSLGDKNIREYILSHYEGSRLTSEERTAFLAEQKNICSKDSVDGAASFLIVAGKILP
jgi:SAM-dependent methyltransferase